MRAPFTLSSSGSRGLFGMVQLVLALVAVQRAPRQVAGDLLALTVSSSSAPPGALDKARADAASLLQKFAGLEGAAYDAVAPGQKATLDDADRRMLRGGEEEEEEDEGEDLEAGTETGLQHPASRKLFDCPNKRSNSGSLTCILMGCAFCGSCRRSLQSLSSNKHRKIENRLSSDLTAAYCQGKSDCVITASIMRVNGDGTLSMAV